MTESILHHFGGIDLSQKVHKLHFTGNPPLAHLAGTSLLFFFSHQYEVIQEAGAWKVRTTGYLYRLDSEKRQEILSYHWHPPRPRYPHIHLAQGSGVQRSDLRDAHIPTGRVAIESIVEFLIRDLKVQPLRPDWEEVLERNRAIFEGTRSWS